MHGEGGGDVGLGKSGGGLLGGGKDGGGSEGGGNGGSGGGGAHNDELPAKSTSPPERDASGSHEIKNDASMKPF